jgi:hypothetical protein
MTSCSNSDFQIQLTENRFKWAKNQIAMCCINWTMDLIVIILIDFVLWTKYVCTLDMNYVFRFRISHCVLEFLIYCAL